MAQKIKNLFSRHRLLIVIFGALLIIGALAVIIFGLIIPAIQRDVSQGQTNPALVDSSSDGSIEVSGGDGRDSNLQVSLSMGNARPQPTEPAPIASGEPLSDEEIEQILARLPTQTVEAADQVDFKLPEEPLPPPRTGETIEEKFPPSQELIGPETIEVGALEVLRYSPEGEIPLAPFVNVTFNQPMVPLTTLNDLTLEEVPVKLEPALPGTWRWLGTKTLNFQYDSLQIDRLPMATEYQVTIPAGTESATGGILEEAVSWSFNTPPPKMITKYPHQDNPQPLDPLFFIAFDQRVNPDPVLATIQVTANNQPVRISQATEVEIERNEDVSRLTENSGEGRWLVFRAKELLPADAAISVLIGPGIPSAEGPLVTKEAQQFNFRTYAPLRIDRYDCSWSRDNCPPLTPFFIEFNNPIDVDSYEDAMVDIAPALPGATVNIFGDTINIRGATEGRTTYKVTVDKEIRDIFGQTLGKDTTLTFRVGSAEPFLTGPDEILVTLDPSAHKPVFSVYSINYDRLHVRIYSVEPSDWPAYKEYLREYHQQEPPLKPPGRLALEETISLDTPADILSEVDIDLSRASDGDFGHFILIIEPTSFLRIIDRDRYRHIVQAWVQVTQIGLDAFVDHSEMLVWTSALQDGAPLAGISIETEPAGVKTVTGKDGTTSFNLPEDGVIYVAARQGDDVAMLPHSMYYWRDDAWSQRSVYDELRWYVFDDREMYRPGEEVHVKGWMRRVGGKQDGDVGMVGSEVTNVSYRVVGPQGNDITNGRSEVNALGGFDFTFTLPENTNLGYSQIYLDATGSLRMLNNTQYQHNFQIQEFRRPEFEVAARNETTGPYFAGEHAVIAVGANYYAGGPLPNAEVNWQVTSSPSNYTPPNWSDFTFGIWKPWWYYEPVYIEEAYNPFGPQNGETEVETFTGITDASGNHYLRLDFDEPDQSRPFSVLAEATVFDVNRQAWAATTSLLVHPADLYVGLRSEHTFVERGTPLEIDLIVTDLDGNAVPDQQVEVTAARLDWKYRKGDWGEEEVDIQECILESALEPVTCTFETKLGGRYQITALVTDEIGRQNQTQFIRWVSGGQQPPARKVEQETVVLIPDKESYQPGDVANILVQAPFSPAEGLLTVSRSGILYTERFQMDETTTTLHVPIEEKHIPNLNVQVDLIGEAPRLDDEGEVLADVPPRPAYAAGQLNLRIPPLQRTLSLQATPRETELEPGGETTIDLVLTDAGRQPVPGAELTVVVVDEAILALSNYQLADPMVVFYRNRPSDFSSHYGRSSIVLADPQTLAEDIEAGGEFANEILGTQVAGKAVMEEAEAPAAEPLAEDRAAPTPSNIQVRSNFNPLATYTPEVRTDANGRAEVTVQLPDNLTRYRVMVVAVDGGNQFGAAETNLVARLPLMVRPSAPRFLNFGDSFELPVVVQNQTDKLLTVDIVVQASNIELTSSPGQRVNVPARDRLEVRFPATTVMPGIARFQITAVSNDYADAATVELPVYTPATTEAFATYGVIDKGAVVQPVGTPNDVFPQFGGLEISTSSTALQALTDAVLYLVSYPFECTEQIASRILAVAALRDVLEAFSADGLPSPEEMERAVVRDIDMLQGLQNNDGGFPYWKRGRDSIPYHTAHVAHALQRAKLMGFEVPEDMQLGVQDYLLHIEDHFPSWYSLQIRRTISAYALYVRHLMDDTDRDKAQRLLDEAGLDELSLEAVGWLWMVLAEDPAYIDELEAIRRHVNNRAVETAGAANFTTSYGDDAYLLLHSNRRTDAILLDALIVDSPQNDLIPKVVNGLLAHRTKGRWYNTQENVFVLLAMDRYFNTFEAQTPDFVARIWLGDTYAGSHEFAGRTTERHATEIPMAFLLDEADGTQDLILSKDGPGRLYYRLGLRYSPTDLTLDPLDMGFVVQRRYEAVDDPEDVYQDEEGVWHIKAGARVRVRLTMVADNRRYHVALVDPLPAGLEIVNPSLAVSGSIPQDPTSSDYRYGWWWWGSWYEHQNMRDERAEAFASLLWDGVYDYSYIARATTPGKFVVPPAKAEEMYSPEVFGRSGSDWVIVE